MRPRGEADRPAGAGRPVIFGEVLFDRFPDGSEVLGGAPFNVAWHLQGLGGSPLLVTRVGEDAAGRRVLEAMARWGMDTTGVQVDPERPTGRVEVSLEGGEPRFDILPGVAYDRIDEAAAQRAAGAAGPCALLYHGSLAVRETPSREALAALRRATGAPRFVDVNLRPPWWEREGVAGLLRGAAWIKLNAEELERLHGPGDPATSAEALRRRAGARAVILTLGAEGALLAHEGGSLRRRAEPARVVDTVGAGDAFSAVAILGLLAGWPWERLLERAVGFAAAVCGLRGAVTEERAFYEAHLRDWGETGGRGA